MLVCDCVGESELQEFLELDALALVLLAGIKEIAVRIGKLHQRRIPCCPR